MKFTIIKNKLASPFKVGTIVYNWNTGFDTFSEIGDLALEFGVIKIEGKTYKFPELPDFKVVGKKNAIQYLKDNSEYTETVIKPLILEYLNKTNVRNESIPEITN